MSIAEPDLGALVAQAVAALGLPGTASAAPSFGGAPAPAVPGFDARLPAPPAVPGVGAQLPTQPTVAGFGARIPTHPAVPAFDAQLPARPSADFGLADTLARAATDAPYFLASPSPIDPAPHVPPTHADVAIPLFSPTTRVPVGAAGPLDVAAVRRDFPILATRVHGRPLVWLDNAATTQKPRAVIERLTRFYETENSNIHRAAHTLAARATDAYEAARDSVRRFLGAASRDDIVFVRGATEGINLLAKSWGTKNVGPGDEIVLSHLEHHSNIVPWQMLADAVGARLRVLPVDDRGQLRLEEAERLIGPRTKIVAVTHVSNALGTLLPVAELARLAHRHGARILVDGAQAVSHMPVDVGALGVDFYLFSGHKVFGPTGIGAVFGTPDAWRDTPPWQGGGNMIADVTFDATRYAEAPARFEAGTGNIADAVGLGAALEYLLELGMHRIAAHEEALLAHGTARLREVPGLHLVGTAAEKAGVLSFVLDGHRPEAVGRALDREGIAVRSGHHCAQPALRRFGHEATVRPSLALYNTRDELDLLADCLHALVRRGPGRTA
jgi:cysteine desulfurase/selenocysteine lyase